MTLKELKKMEIFKAANKVIYHNADGTIDIDIIS